MEMKDFSPQTDLDGLAATLDEYGVAVLPNVFSEAECETFKKKMFDLISTKFEVNEPNDYLKLRPVSGGILHGYGVALAEPCLTLKTDERVIEAFSRVWPEANGQLTTSLDGILIGPPPELTTPSRFFRDITFHTDQASNKNKKCCVQAFINLETTETGDGCLSTLTRSHKHHAHFFRHFGLDSHGRDWFVINKTTHPDWFIKKGCEWNTIMAPKGSMVFFDSRTFHTGTLPRAYRPNPNRWRFVVYVCYTPASWQTPEDAELKRLAYMNNQCTAHWPYGSVRLFNKPWDDMTENSLDNLTDRHKKCLGI